MKRFLFLFLLLSRAAMGQTPDSVKTISLPPKSDFKYSFFLSASYALAATSMPNLRSYFRANDITLDSPFDQFAHLNAGFRYKRFKFITQSGQGFDYLSSRLEDDKRVAQQDLAAYAGAMLGYDILNGRNRRIYVNIGTGTFMYNYSVFRRTEQPVDFQDLAQYSQPGNIPSLKLSNSYLDFNLEVSFREKRKQGAEPIVRVGYRRGLRARTWQSDAFDLRGAPTERISQFYIQTGYHLSFNWGKAGGS